MDGRWLKAAFLNDTGTGLDLDIRLQSAPKVMLDIVCADIADRTLAERLFEMHASSLVGLVCLLCADRRLGVVLQEKIHPVREL